MLDRLIRGLVGEKPVEFGTASFRRSLVRR